MSFKKLKLPSYLLDALAAMNYEKPYPIQTEVIPAVRKKQDVLGIAKTGSGKTLSYVLPILRNLEGVTKLKNRHINTLVLVPTRELAIQVEEVFRSFEKYVPYPFRSMAVYGGVSINPQMQKLNNINVLVATPGRLLELYEKNAVNFSSVSTLVLDEADKMLNLGFKEEMDQILGKLPFMRQNLLFSATLSPDINTIQAGLLKDPVVVDLGQEEQDITLIKQLAYQVTPERKGPLLRHLIIEKNIRQVLIFTSSTHQADVVADKLFKNGITARAIHSKKGQGNRKKSLQMFKDGELTALVATDLLARGVDIDALPYVINYELPRSPKDFIHRIGRTGRAEQTGEAYTFITEEDEHHFKVIQKKMKKQVETVDAATIDLQGY
ncbi:DEAD/DEAH box helicase [Algivirga pacifica]|uniref:ATP-dependent RNA helicase RhlE n=1 Tax=Algivirga pacifica TaxID=1162670 RepID=A0ABP9DAD7_9BACT